MFNSIKLITNETPRSDRYLSKEILNRTSHKYYYTKLKLIKQLSYLVSWIFVFFSTCFFKKRTNGHAVFYERLWIIPYHNFKNFSHWPFLNSLTISWINNILVCLLKDTTSTLKPTCHESKYLSLIHLSIIYRRANDT